MTPARLEWLARTVRYAERKWKADVVLLGERIRDGEVVIEEGLTGFPYTPFRSDAVPVGSYAAIVTTDQLRTWLREHGKEVA